MTRNRYAARPPLYGMVLVFSAIAIVAIAAALHAGWWSMAGYALAGVLAATGAVLAFRDLS